MDMGRFALGVEPLFVSVYTVEAHRKRAYAKLGVRSRAQLSPRPATAA
jgi:hypothetical protein